MPVQPPVRVLQVLNHMDYGGIEAVVMNYYRFTDQSKVQFDFAVSEDSILPQKNEIQKRNGTIYLLPRVSRFSRYISALKKIIQENDYQIVHCHLNTLSVFPLLAAFLAGTKVRICHNHTTAHFGEGKRTIVKCLLRPFCKWFATDYFACGEYAGKWMYGNICVHTNRVYIMKNAVDVNKFCFHPEIRSRVRDELGLKDQFVIGHIGRFVYPKNHNFLIDVFYEIYQRKHNAVLLLVGDGELEVHVREKVKRLGLSDAVIFYGSCKDTSSLYQAMDVFCLPSFYEGVPMVAIEAQVSGLPVVFSNNVSYEIRVLESCEAVSLEMPPEIWAERTLKYANEEKNRAEGLLKMIKTGYSIKEEAGNMQEHYLKRVSDSVKL